MENALLLVLSAVLSALGLWFQDWRNKRSLESRRQRVLREANDHVVFLKEWLAVQSSASPDEVERARVQISTELREVYEQVADVRRSEDDLDTTFGLRQLLLLHLRPIEARTRLMRRLYYVSLVWLTIVTISVANDVGGVEEDRSWYVASAIIVGLMPALVFRALAMRSAERSH